MSAINVLRNAIKDLAAASEAARAILEERDPSADDEHLTQAQLTLIRAETAAHRAMTRSHELALDFAGIERAHRLSFFGDALRRALGR